MKDLVVIGAGGFGREVVGLIERINVKKATWNIKGFLDDNMRRGSIVNGYEVLGKIDEIEKIENTWAVCSVGHCETRENIIKKLQKMRVCFATIVDPMTTILSDIEIGEGSIICAGSVLTVNVKIGKHVIINLNTTIGHDCVIGDYCTVSPGTNISGYVNLGKCVDVGTGSKIIQGKCICDNTVLGAGTVVVKDIRSTGIYVGVPAHKIK